MLYFVYGSNLNHFQMKRRCKDSKFIKKYNLKNFRQDVEVNIGSLILNKKKFNCSRRYLKFQKVMKRN